MFHDDLRAETRGDEGTSKRRAFLTEGPASTATCGGVGSGVFKRGA